MRVFQDGKNFQIIGDERRNKMKTLKKFTVDEKIIIPELAGKQWGKGTSKRKFTSIGDVPGRPIGYKCDDSGRLFRRSNNGWTTVNLARIGNYAILAAKADGIWVE